MPSTLAILGGIAILDRMEDAVFTVRQRMLRAAAALDAAGVPYAIASGNAVAAWVSSVDKAAVRFTQDVDILIRRADLSAATIALGKVGFIYRHVRNLDIFLDGPDAKMRDALHLIFAGEKVRAHETLANPDVTESVISAPIRVLDLAALVKIKLTAYRDKDRTHLRDLLDVGLIDAAWLDKLPAELAGRLKDLIDTPDG